jgi:hypothetical protein
LPSLLFSGDQLSFRRDVGAMSSHSDFWMYDTSGVLRPAVKAYLKGKPMTAQYIAAFRVYLRVWIFTPEFVGDGVEALRQAVDGLASREAIEE